MSEQREMTLEEWVNKLPEFHLVNKQYQQLRQEIERLRNQRHYFRVIYMGNVLNTFMVEKEADDYNNNFGGVYSVEKVGFV